MNPKVRFDDPPWKWAIFSVVGLLAYVVLGVSLAYWYPVVDMSHWIAAGLLVILVIGLLFGGCLFNGLIWTYVGKGIFGPSFNDCHTCCVCSFPCFICFGVLLAGATAITSPIEIYREVAGLEPLQHVSLCGKQTWEGFYGGIYFEDGTLTQSGHMPEATRIDIPECYRVVSKKFPSISHTYACHVVLRPVFNCDPENSLCPKPRACAWAMTGVEEDRFSVGKMAEAPTTPECGGSSEICGMQFNFRFFMTHLARNPEAMDTVRSALKISGAQFPASNLTADSPMLMLVNPAQFRADILYKLNNYWICWFLFIPCGAISGFLVAACKRLGQSSLNPWRRLEDDDEPESGASSSE